MNFTPDFGWYYISPEDRSPAWAGVPYFWDFMTRTEPSVGPWGMSTTQNFIRPGDFVQLRFTESGDIFAHTPGGGQRRLAAKSEQYPGGRPFQRCGQPASGHI